ncbi:MAG: hypothetical protein DI629_11570 [Mesorhizobium amorphae]|nr:MAG: hypothetical protein DI629_11570 [Mesorhizobium amorphae]
MIVRSRPNFFQLFFIMRGSVLPRVLPHIFGFAAYGAGVTALFHWLRWDWGPGGIAPFALVGVALSIYLGFRNSAAYDRWWEARKLWGQLVFDTRNLARAVSGLVADESERRRMLRSVPGFAHFLRGQVRGVDGTKEAAAFLGAAEAARHAGSNNPADSVLRAMGAQAGHLFRTGSVDSIGFRILDERLSAFSAVQAGCERIAGTPLPFAYTLLLQRTAYVFCLLLPWGMASAMGWLTPLFTGLMAYTFFALDALSEELEDPFGTEANDLALDALCRVCEISVAESLGDPPPPPLAPERFYYS